MTWIYQATYGTGFGSPGLDTIQGSHADDGRTIIWNKGGEVRYFIDVADNYLFITSSQRMEDGGFHFGAVSMAIIERYLYGHFGGSVRSIKGLDRLRKPIFRDEVHTGYSISVTSFAGDEQDALVDSRDAIVAIATIDRLVGVSHYINVTVDGIKTFFLDPLVGHCLSLRRDCGYAANVYISGLCNT